MNEVPVWNPNTHALEPSGVTATDGELIVSPDSVVFGNHRMSSSIENVIFTNTDTGQRYAPLWQDYESGNDQANVRAFSPVEDVVRVPAGSVNVTNPVNTGVTIDKDETFFGGKFILAQQASDVEMKITDSNGEMVWRDKLGDLGVGEHTVTFDTPFDVKQGYRYNISLSSPSGDVVAKSNGSSGFSWTVKRSTWTDKELALVEDLADFINRVTLVDGDKLEFTHQDGAKHQILLPSGGGTGGNTNPKAVISISKSSGNFVFNHADGTVTTLRDNTGASASRVDGIEAEVNANKQSISNIDGKLAANTKEIANIKKDDVLTQEAVTKLQQDDTELHARVAALEGKPITPARAIPELYGTFGTTWPTTIVGAAKSSNSRITITRQTASPQRAFIMVPSDHGSAVTGIKQGEGIPALWASQILTIDGKEYRVFYSPRGLNETSATFTVNFAQGNMYV